MVNIGGIQYHLRGLFSKTKPTLCPLSLSAVATVAAAP